MEMFIFRDTLVVLLFINVMCSVFCAPVNDDADVDTESIIDGDQLISLGETMGKPLIALFGRALVQSDRSMKRYVSNNTSEFLSRTEVGQMVEKKLNNSLTSLFGDVCAQNLCGDWTRWSACSGSTTGVFGSTARSRTCGNNMFQICQNERNEITEEQNKVCKVCGPLPDISNGKARLNDKDPTIAHVSCDNFFKSKKDVVVCKSTGKWEEPSCEPTDCLALKALGVSTDGVYNITLPRSATALQVFCDMTTAGGGWTVFQNRYDGSIDFYRNFTEYENGFGNLKTEFWLGLRHIREMVSVGKTDLRIDLEVADGTKAFETFEDFSLSNDAEYRLMLGRKTSYENTKDDRLRTYHSGHAFSTFDRDLDKDSGNCAVNYEGAWWYNKCYNANLNGKYLPPGTKDWKGMTYNPYRGSGGSLKTSKMMFRRIK